MGPLVLFALAILGCAVPDLAPRFLGLASHPPDVFVAIAVYLGLRGRGTGALVGAVLLGVLRDAASLDPLGTHAFVLAAVTCVFLRPDRTRPPTGVARAAAVAGACVLAQALLVLRLLVVSRDGPALSSVFAVVPTAFVTAVVSWPLLSLLDRTHALDDLTGAPRGLSS